MHKLHHRRNQARSGQQLIELIQKPLHWYPAWQALPARQKLPRLLQRSVAGKRGNAAVHARLLPMELQMKLDLLPTP